MDTNSVFIFLRKESGERTCYTSLEDFADANFSTQFMSKLIAKKIGVDHHLMANKVQKFHFEILLESGVLDESK